MTSVVQRTVLTEVTSVVTLSSKRVEDGSRWNQQSDPDGASVHFLLGERWLLNPDIDAV